MNIYVVSLFLYTKQLLARIQYNPSFFLHGRGEQIPGVRLPRQLKFVRWRLIIVGPQYETCFMLTFDTYNFEVALRFLKKMSTPALWHLFLYPVNSYCIWCPAPQDMMGVFHWRVLKKPKNIVIEVSAYFGQLASKRKYTTKCLHGIRTPSILKFCTVFVSFSRQMQNTNLN
jgi:hypothetical protein